MAKYILLKKNSAKVPLLGTKSKPYTAQIDNNIVTNWYLMDEAWLVTNVYMGNKAVIAQSLRTNHPDIGPNEIDKFIEIVKKDHPLEHIDFNWNDIPLYATAKSYCDLPLPWLYKAPIKLTQEQEKELLSIVQDDKAEKKERMIDWFKKYRNDYGIEARLKRDREIQDECLAEIFCMVHGFDMWEIQSIIDSQSKIGQKKQKTSDPKIKPISDMIVAIGCTFPFIVMAILVDVEDKFWLYIIPISFIVFCVVSIIQLYVNLPSGQYKNVWKEVFSEAFIDIKTLSKIIIVLIAVICIPFSLLLLGNESDSWMVGILCAIPFFLVVGGIANFLKRK